VTYFVRGAVISLAMFFAVYCFFSLAIAAAWRVLRGKRKFTAGLLYGIRILPLAVAAVAASFFIVPSFLYLEPFGDGETVGFSALLLAFGGAIVIVAGLLSAVWAWWSAVRFASKFACGRHFSLDSGLSAVELGLPGPLILVAGIWRPTFFVSRQARELLGDREMHIAIEHELAHVRFRDNLKKLLLLLCRFPFFGDLERSWSQAAEFAADDAAVRDQSSALDLASALLTIASGPQPAQLPVTAMRLVSSSDEALRERVERLLAWQPHAERYTPGGYRPLIAIALGLFITTYVPLLARIHELTELLVR